MALSGDFLGAVLIAALYPLMFCSAIKAAPKTFHTTTITAPSICQHNRRVRCRAVPRLPRGRQVVVIGKGDTNQAVSQTDTSSEVRKMFPAPPRASHGDIYDDQKCSVVIDSDGSDKFGNGGIWIRSETF